MFKTRAAGIRFFGFMVAMCLGLLHDVHAQAYPSRPVRIIVATGTATAADFVGRVLAQHLSKLWGTPVFVENITGAAGVIGTTAIVKAAPDGYTLGVIGTQHMINRAFNPNLPYDSVKDLKGVASIVSSTLVIAVHPSLGVNSIGELIALAKSKPTVINFGSSGSGGLLHLVMEQFSQQAGVKMTHIPYKTVGAMTIDLLAGRVSVAAATGTTLLPLVKAGKLKALLVTNGQRSQYFPDIPIGAEVGLPGVVVGSWNGLAVPENTPDAIVAKIYADIATIAKSKEFEAQLLGNGMEVQLANGEQTWKRVLEEGVMWNKLVKEVGIKAD